MSASRSLPARPSLESLRKQAKKLARDAAAGDADALARVRAHLPNVVGSLTQRNAQFIIAREYGFAGWQDITAEVNKRSGTGLGWAVAQADRAIHDNDTERLKQLLAEFPALLSWKGDEDHGSLLSMATGAFGDAFDAERERNFTRRECAELLIDAGAIVTPEVTTGILDSRARGLLRLFDEKRLLPRTLEFRAALGDLDAVRSDLAGSRDDFAAVNEAFARACSFHHQEIASLLLDRLIPLDPELGRRIDAGPGRNDFIAYLIEHGPGRTKEVGPWTAFVMQQVRRAAHVADVPAFTGGLKSEPSLLGDAHVDFQDDLIGVAAVNDCESIIAALLDLDPAIVRRQPPPRSHAIEYAVTYGNTHLLPLLTRVWPLPDDLAYSAAVGNLERVKQWFDASGQPALGDLERHYPYNDAHAREMLHWAPRSQQQILDTALAFSVINRHFDVADFLLEHGANINTDWNSHEPASILHHLVFEDNYESMQYLIDRGIDMTIRDYRWDATAYGWALHGKNDPKMAQWLQDAERERTTRSVVGK